MTSDELTVLLIEDNPGDARLFEEMLAETTELSRRTTTGGSVGDSLRIRHEQRLSDGLDALESLDVDVVLLDLNLPDSTDLDTLETVIDHTERLPIVVLTGLDDRHVGVQAIEQGAQDYLVKDNVTSDLLVRSIHHALERNRQERERARRREQLEALNSLNRIVQDVTHAVITTTTQEDLERAVCERLVESDAYRFAWIGEVSGSNGRITPRVSAGGGNGYLDDVEITADDDDTAQGPAGRAVRSQEVQVMQDIQTDPAFEPWRDAAIERGYHSSAAIPIVYDDVLYGVLNVYAASPNAFSEPEADILGRLGTVIGHAIAAIERKEALVSDTVLELEFRVDEFARELVAVTGDQSSVAFENLVRSDANLVAYGRVEGIHRDEFTDAAERTDAVERVRVLRGRNEEFEFEAVAAVGWSLFETLAQHGGSVESAEIDDGEFRFTVQFPHGHDTRPVIDLVTEHCPGASLLAKRTDERDADQLDDATSGRDRLTEKQRMALETAYHAGHFEWPRETNGEEIADLLGIAPPTFHQHLRAAEKEFFDLVFDSE